MTVRPYRRLTEAERKRTVAQVDRLRLAGQCAWLEDRTDPDDWREFVCGWARRLGVKVWPELLRELRRDAPHPPEWVRAEAAAILAAQYARSGDQPA